MSGHDGARPAWAERQSIALRSRRGSGARAGRIGSGNVHYHDETLEELWRFNVGTPLKGAPVTYSVGAKQYLAVQTSGRHLHPVKFDKLENSSYLFLFALN